MFDINHNETLTIAPLYCPIEPAINNYVEAAHDYAMQWACNFQLVQPHGAQYQRLRCAKFAHLAARTYPDASFEDLKLIANWAIWLFFHDDVCDTSMAARNPDQLSRIDTRLLEILDGAEITAEDAPLALALHDFRQQLLQRTSEVWVHRFTESVQQYFQANRWEAATRMCGINPDLATYTKMSQFTGAVYTGFILLCIAKQINPDANFVTHACVQQLSLMANNIICWHNDILGVLKEIKERNMSNLVLVLQREHQISLQEALNRAVTLCNAEMTAFLNLTSQLPSFGAREAVSFKHYLNGLRSWIRGHFDWYTDTGRYQVPDGHVQTLAI